VRIHHAQKSKCDKVFHFICMGLSIYTPFDHIPRVARGEIRTNGMCERRFLRAIRGCTGREGRADGTERGGRAGRRDAWGVWGDVRRRASMLRYEGGGAGGWKARERGLGGV